MFAVKPVTFAADVVGDAVVRAGRLAITVNFHDGRAAFDENWESVAFRFHRLFLCLSAQILSEKCPTLQAKSFQKAQFTYEDGKSWQRVVIPNEGEGPSDC